MQVNLREVLSLWEAAQGDKEQGDGSSSSAANQNQVSVDFA